MVGKGLARVCKGATTEQKGNPQRDRAHQAGPRLGRGDGHGDAPREALVCLIAACARRNVSRA